MYIDKLFLIKNQRTVRDIEAVEIQVIQPKQRHRILNRKAKTECLEKNTHENVTQSKVIQ